MALRTLFVGLVAIQSSLAAPVDTTASDFPHLLARDAPKAILRPIQAPAGDNVPAAEQVVPQSSATLYYAGTPSGNSPHASAAVVSIPELIYDSVNAAGASAITNVDCSNKQARVTFANQDAFDQAAASWTAAGRFSLITFSDTCGTGTDDGTHDFLLVNNVASHSADTLTILVNYDDIALEDAVADDIPISVQVGSAAVNSSGKTSERLSIGGISIPLPNLDPSWSPSISKSVSFNKYPTNAQSPWGAAYKVYGGDKLSAYCVGCGADGAFTITATATFTLLHGLKSGSVNVNGNLNGAVVAGLDGSASVTVPLPTITLAQLALEGLSVPGIFSIGPVATIAVGGAVTVGAAGQLEVGAKLHWPSIRASIDFVGGSGSGISGWQPTVEPVFAAAGTIKSTLDLHLVNTLAFGISILNGKFSKQVALIDEPGVQISASIDGTASLNNGVLSGTFTGPCHGVSLSAVIYNHLTANILGLKTFDLFDWTSSALTKCIVINSPAVIAPPAKSSAAPVVIPVINVPATKSSSTSSHTSTSSTSARTTSSSSTTVSTTSSASITSSSKTSASTASDTSTTLRTSTSTKISVAALATGHPRAARI